MQRCVDSNSTGGIARLTDSFFLGRAQQCGCAMVSSHGLGLLPAYQVTSSSYSIYRIVVGQASAKAWFLGNDGESCTTVCANHGGACDSESLSVMDNLRNNPTPNLQSIAASLGAGCSRYLSAGNGNGGISPHMYTGPHQSYAWHDQCTWGGLTTNCDVSNGVVRRFCYC